jgi:hypothetical protein
MIAVPNCSGSCQLHLLSLQLMVDVLSELAVAWKCLVKGVVIRQALISERGLSVHGLPHPVLQPQMAA